MIDTNGNFPSCKWLQNEQERTTGEKSKLAKRLLLLCLESNNLKTELNARMMTVFKRKCLF